MYATIRDLITAWMPLFLPAILLKLVPAIVPAQVVLEAEPPIIVDCDFPGGSLRS